MKPKLLIALLAAVFLLSIVTAFLIVFSDETEPPEDIYAEVFARLHAIREEKQEQISSYFKSVHTRARQAVSDPVLINVFKEKSISEKAADIENLGTVVRQLSGLTPGKQP